MARPGTAATSFFEVYKGVFSFYGDLVTHPLNLGAMPTIGLDTSGVVGLQADGEGIPEDHTRHTEIDAAVVHEIK